MIYSLLKLLHLAAVIIFLGNIITGHFWMHIALQTRDVKIILHTVKGVIRSDRLFTVPGVILIITAGLLAAISGSLPVLRTGWIFWSIILFSISGFVFTLKLVPLQKKIYNLIVSQDVLNDSEWLFLKKVYLDWVIWALIAMAVVAGALVMMILKIPH